MRYSTPMCAGRSSACVLQRKLWSSRGVAGGSSVCTALCSFVLDDNTAIGASSVAGKKGWAFNSFYSASKSAIRSFTQALGEFKTFYYFVWSHLSLLVSCVIASELGSHGITVNAYAPGPVETHLRMFAPCYFSCHLRFPTPHPLPIFFVIFCILMLTWYPVRSSCEEFAKKVGFPDGKTFIQSVCISISLLR